MATDRETCIEGPCRDSSTSILYVPLILRVEACKVEQQHGVDALFVEEDTEAAMEANFLSEKHTVLSLCILYALVLHMHFT